MASSITPSSYLIFFLLKKKSILLGCQNCILSDPKIWWKSELKIKDFVNLIVKPCFFLKKIDFDQFYGINQV